VQYLLALEGDQAVHVDAGNRAALQIACTDGVLDIVQELVNHALSHTQSGNSATPFLNCLRLACVTGRVAVVEFFFERLQVAPQDASALIVECMRDVCRENHVGVTELLMTLQFAPSQDVADAIFDGFADAHAMEHVEITDLLLPTVRELQHSAYRTEEPRVLQAIASYDDEGSILYIENSGEVHST
jgi:hypothetical protein